jgi:hypothetical protein
MVSESDRAFIRRKFTSEPDPDQLELLADETLDAMRNRRVSEPAGRRKPVRKTRAHE